MFERTGELEVHPLARDGMFEGDGLCLEIQAVGLLAVELVAEDGTAETVGVGAMHAQLMGSAGMGP